jgi:hypothetical protein
MSEVQFVDKKKGIIICTECGGSKKMLDTFAFEYSMGTKKQLIPCWVCEGAGTLKLDPPVKDVTNEHTT